MDHLRDVGGRSSAPSESRRFAGRGPSMLLAVAIVLSALVAVGNYADEFPNADIAGIAYEADLILDGGLPYVDTLEFKGMGTFWLWAAIFMLLGRSLEAVQLVYFVWTLLGVVAVYTAARVLYGGRHPYAASLAAAVTALYGPMFSYNYSGWMTPLLAWTFTLTMLSLLRRSWGWAFAAGAMGVGAYVFKHQAAAFGVALPILWLWARRTRQPGARAKTVLGWCTGAACAISIPVAGYAWAGHADAIWTGLLPLDRAQSYRAAAAEIGLLELVGHASEQFAMALPLGASLLVLLIVGAMRQRRAENQDLVPLLAFFGASWLSIAIGGARFFPHYLVQYLPATALLAAHPSGALRLLERPGIGGHGSRLFVGLALAFQLWEIGTGGAERSDIVIPRLAGGLTAPQAAGVYIQRKTTPEDRIQCWGWTAWPVYYWAQRSAPGRIYKPMGTVTTSHGSTAFRPSPPIHFKPGPEADAFLRDLQSRPPAYFVHSDAFITVFGSPTDPIEEFTALRLWLGNHYRPVARLGDLLLLEHERLSVSGARGDADTPRSSRP